MSLFDRRYVLIGLAALAGCGFEPVYGPNGAARGLSGRVGIDPPRDSEGFALVRQLEDRLGHATDPIYRLSAQITIDEVGRGITADQIITRFNVRGTVDYTLTEIGTGSVATRGTVANFTGYSTTGTPVATQSARRDARDRLMAILADQIVAELLATAPDWRP